MAKTDWAALIVQCLKILVDEEKLETALLGKDNPPVEEVLPLLPWGKLYKSCRKDEDIPVGGPPKVFSDWPSGADPDKVSGTVSLEYTIMALKPYFDLRTHHTHVLLDSFEKVLARIRVEAPSGKPKSGRKPDPKIQKRRRIVRAHVKTKKELTRNRWNLDPLFQELDQAGIPLPSSSRYSAYSGWSNLVSRAKAGNNADEVLDFETVLNVLAKDLSRP